MIIPYGTNAPIYHYPFATVGLIVVNVVVFLLTWPQGSDAMAPWILAHGNGLHPVQWVSSIFLHAGPFHLIGNTIFLWCFGLVVEGKTGWWKFLLIYLAVGVGQCALEQVLMLWSDSAGSLGASSAIIGLLAVAVVWAPRNDFNVIWVVYIRWIYYFDVPILLFGSLMIGWECLLAMLTDFAMSSALLHVMGAALGFPIGFAMLTAGMVDCEGFDLLSIFRGEEGLDRLTPQQREQRQEQNRLALQLLRQRIDDCRRQVGVFLQEKNIDAAIRLFEKARKMDASIRFSREELLTIIMSLGDAKQWDRVIGYLEEYQSRFEEDVDSMRLRLAQIVLLHQHRPAKALRILSAIAAEALPPTQQQLRWQLIAKARQMRAQGEVELQDE